MTADTRLTINVSPFTDHRCESYICQQGGTKIKYAIGNVNGFGHMPIFCEDCVRHLVTHIPPELVPGGEKLEKKLRNQISAEYEELLTIQVKKIRAELEEQAEKAAILKVTETGAFKITDYVPVVNEVEEVDVKTYRCLDCSEDFTSKEDLNKHKQIHKKVKA